jgi:hypothetical protein
MVYDNQCLGFEVLTAVLIKIQVSWDVADILEKCYATTYGV